MYIKKAIRERIETLIRYVDYTGLPSNWEAFINEQKVRLIIKNKDNYKCNYCNKVFYSNKKVNEYEICPKCHNKALIKSNRLTWYNEKKDLYFIDKYNDEYGYVIRIFELWSHFSSGKMSYSVINWGMIVLNEYLTQSEAYVSNNFKSNMGSSFIAHYEETKEWRPYCYQLKENGTYYPYNLNQLFNYKYYDLEKMAINCNNLHLTDILYGVIKGSRSLEMLMKAGLYNLAFYFGEYEKNGSFKDIFGVDISYLPFMQENNITQNELEQLAKYKIKDIKFIKYMTGIYFDYQLEKYCKPYDLFKYNPGDLYTYKDYLRFASELGFDLTDKKYLYPKDLKEKHDELMKQVEMKKNKKIQNSIRRRYKKLLENQFQGKKYVIFPANSISSMEDESSQQNNCVKTYAEDYAKGRCDIYFMRLVESQDKSLVTVEVRDNKVVQNRIKNNQKPGKEELLFLKKWEQKVLNKEVTS
jgi:DNA-directed RNA polymerase subunit RPC12/RpoP